MSKPHVICHMASSLDGKILPKRWMPKGVHDPDIYEHLHRELGGGSWLVGRTTGQEFAKRDSYPESSLETFPREPWLPHRTAAAYGIALDRAGKIAWGRSDVDGDPILVVLSEQVSDAHLAGLRSDGVGYLFAGAENIDLGLALDILGSELGVERLLLEGGGTTNGAFLRAGLIDEISLIIEPAIDGSRQGPSVFDGGNIGDAAPSLKKLKLVSHTPIGEDVMWLRYMVERDSLSIEALS